TAISCNTSVRVLAAVHYLEQVPVWFSRTCTGTCVSWQGFFGISSLKLKLDTSVGFVLCHVLAALALLPWFFSWTGVIVAGAGMFVFGILGINVGFHRLLTHRSFSCPLWLERTLAVLGTCSLQFSPAFWVAVHRRHHHYADDEEQDPHSPIRSFIWSH